MSSYRYGNIYKVIYMYSYIYIYVFIYIYMYIYKVVCSESSGCDYIDWLMGTPPLRWFNQRNDGGLAGCFTAAYRERDGVLLTTFTPPPPPTPIPHLHFFSCPPPLSLPLVHQQIISFTL